ncbi:MAG: PQQ-dependent sugar dehydrogenase [Ignavibacteriota bacterium]
MKTKLILIFLFLSAAALHAQYSLTPAFPGMASASSPTNLEFINDGTNRGVLLEQRGQMWIFDNSPTVSTRRLFFNGKTVVTRNGCEAGLLGCAFHPDFKNNRFVYLSFDSGSDPQWYSRIVRYQVSSGPLDTLIPSSAFDIITFPQPVGRCNHKGGCLKFGPDGLLYASFGDGGSGGDPDRNGQNRGTLLGTILRVDIDHPGATTNYSIPDDNPFVANKQGFKPEIYAYGLRNTWKFSFDFTTRKLWAGEVGQGAYEEIDTISNGGNYGWNVMEGFHCYPNGDLNCDSSGMTPPIWEYTHECSDASITGGFVYRGTKMPELIGKYLYADYGTGRIWSLDYEGKNIPVNHLLADRPTPSINVSSFGEDQDHELFFVGYNTGKIYRLSGTAAADILPPLLRDSVGSDPLQKFIAVQDSRTTDAGMRSIAWQPLGNTDLTNFAISYSPQISLCFGDNAEHVVSVRANNGLVSGMIEFIFRDFYWNEVRDTLSYFASSVNESGIHEFPFGLEANNPNPFTSTTKLKYSLPRAAHISLALFDLLGKEIVVIADGFKTEGMHEFDFAPLRLPAGAYILRLECQGKVKSRMIVKN